MNTKEKYVSMFWGAVLVLIGIYFLVTRATSFTIHDPWLGMAFSGGISLLFFGSYYFSGVQKWGWLFPACIFAGITLTVLLSVIFPVAEGGWVAAPVLLSIAVPFVAAYFLNREKRKWALIPAYAMVAVTLIAALADLIQGEAVALLVMLLVGLPFLLIYLTDRTRRWGLIVFGVLAVIGVIPVLTTGISNIIWPLILIAAGALVLFGAFQKKAA